MEVGTELDLDAWCPGNLARLDAYTGALKSVAGAPDELVVTYYLFEPESRNCADGNSRCTYVDRGFVVTTLMQDDHELVHAVGASIGELPYALEEGAATYWGDATMVGSTPVEQQRPLAELLDEYWEGELPGQAYAVVADFVAYLVDEYGRDMFWELVRSSFEGQDRAEFDAAFRGIFGLTFDEAIAAYERDWTPCAPTPVRSAFFECASEPRATVGGGSSQPVEVELSCADGETLGPRPNREGAPRIWQDVTIEVVGPESRTYRIVFEEPADWSEPMTSVQVEVKSCERSCVLPGVHTFLPEPKYNIPDPDPNVFELAPGRYALRVSRAADEPGPVRFRLDVENDR